MCAYMCTCVCVDVCACEEEGERNKRGESHTWKICETSLMLTYP